MQQSNRRYYSSDTDIIDASKINPLSYIEWLKYEPGFDQSIAFEQYTLYLNEWYKKNGVDSSEVQKDYVRNIYINLLKQISLNYTTPDEKRFLSNIDYTNDRDLDIALPFFAKKLKQIAIYYANQRDEVKYTKVKNNLKGSSKGISQIIYKQIADIISTDTQITEQLLDLNLTVNDILLNLNIEIEELYDTEQNYFNIDGSSDKTDYTDNTLATRYNYFNTSILPASQNLFLTDTYTQALIEIISEVPIILQSVSDTEGNLETLVDSNNLTYSISEIVTGTELDRLDDSFFENYQSTGELNINYERLAFQKYAGTDYYYLSTGDSLTDSTTGQLFKATAPHRNILNKYNPTLASVVGENLYKLQFLGGFFTTTGIGVSTFTSYDFIYKFKPELNTIQYFPDPATGVGGFYGSYDKNKSPIQYFENVNWNKLSVTKGYTHGYQNQLTGIPRFYPYQSTEQTNKTTTGVSRYDDKFDFWSGNGENIWTNADIYGEQTLQTDIDTRNQQLLQGDKIVYSWKTDIYGNNFILVKDNVNIEKDAKINTGTTITDTEYITTAPTRKSSKTQKYGWQTKTPGKTHDNKNLNEQLHLPGTLYIRNNSSSGTQTITDSTVINLYEKYTGAGTIEINSTETVTLSSIGDEIVNNLIKIDLIHDIILFETTSYIVIEKINYDYTTGIISSGTENYTFLKKPLADSPHDHTGDWWYDEAKQRILFVTSKLHETQSATNSRMIYPVLHNYDMNTLALRQLYPDPDMTNAQLVYETNQYSLSGSSLDVNITSSKPPTITYNKDSERYSVSQLLFDNAKNIYYSKTDFRMYETSIELIRYNFYKGNYFTYSMNSNNQQVDQYFYETHPGKSDTWYHDNSTVFLGATDTLTGPQEITGYNNTVWTYGIESDSFEGVRDITICFDFCMFGDNPGEGLSVLFYNARNATNTGYTTVDTGGLGSAFNYLDDASTGSGTQASLTGLTHGHACIGLDIGGTYGATGLVGGSTPQANSIVVTGPFETALTQRSVDKLDSTKYKLYDNTITHDDLKYLRCRVTLTDLGRRVFVDIMDPETESNFTRISDTQIGDFFPIGPGGTTTTSTTSTTTNTSNPASIRKYYNTPTRINTSLVYCNSSAGGICAIRDITITGSSPTRAGLEVTV